MGQSPSLKEDKMSYKLRGLSLREASVTVLHKNTWSGSLFTGMLVAHKASSGIFGV